MVESSARFLYGLIHARYIVTSRGLAKMVGSLSSELKESSLVLLSAMPLDCYRSHG